MVKRKFLDCKLLKIYPPHKIFSQKFYGIVLIYRGNDKCYGNYRCYKYYILSMDIFVAGGITLITPIILIKNSLTLLRRLFLLRTSTKCASTLCPRFGVGSSYNQKKLPLSE